MPVDCSHSTPWLSTYHGPIWRISKYISAAVPTQVMVALLTLDTSSGYLQARAESRADGHSYGLQIMCRDTSLLQCIADTALHGSLVSIHGKHWDHATKGSVHMSLHIRSRVRLRSEIEAGPARAQQKVQADNPGKAPERQGRRSKFCHWC